MTPLRESRADAEPRHPAQRDRDAIPAWIRLRRTLRFGLLAVVLGGSAHASEAWFERVEQALTVSSPTAWARARLSGTLDLEGYQFSQPAPGFIEAEGEYLFNPRLTMFLDAQAGDHVYAFAQFRADRGFDPGQRRLRGRLDEYAVRVTPWRDGRLSLQAGKFGTVIGAWVPRHGSWDHAFVSAPLAYEHLTGIWDAAAADSAAQLLDWAHVRPSPPPGVPARDKSLRLPIVWGPAYVTGVAVSGELGRTFYAFELKDATVASRPEVWEYDVFRFRRPTVSGRVGFRPNPMWTFGLSASSGTYLVESAAPTVPSGYTRNDYRQELLAQDITFAWHHWQVWAEFFEARYTIPQVGDVDTFSYFVEAKYKLTPQLFGALRWNEQRFSELDAGDGSRARWGRNLWRIDVGPVYRLTPNAQLKLQYSWQRESDGPNPTGHLLALQATIRF